MKHRTELSRSDKAKAVGKLLAILLAFLLAATLWSAAVDKWYPSRADAAEVTAPTSAVPRCGAANDPCAHPKAARKKARQLRAGELTYTDVGDEYRIPKSLKRKMKRAYVRYTRAHPNGPNGMTVGYDWPSPKEWFKDFADSALCAFVGTRPGATSMYCASEENNRMLEHTAALSHEVGRVSIKCSGSMVLGGLASKGAKETARELGTRISGGWGIVAGAAHCGWNEYFDRWWWRK